MPAKNERTNPSPRISRTGISGGPGVGGYAAFVLAVMELAVGQIWLSSGEHAAIHAYQLPMPTRSAWLFPRG